MELDRRERPQPDALGFDHRLMSPERLLQLAGDWPLQFGWVLSDDAPPQFWLDCAKCGKGIEPLTDTKGIEYPVKTGQLLSNVLRHQVMRHELSLSGGGT